MSSKIVTRHSSYSELNLPHLPPDYLACTHCKPSISKASEKGVRPKRIKKCSQLWTKKRANHRELSKVEFYKKSN